jgi:fermentation-respiration switch protein FrsA (DUF1100 family)
VPLAHGQALFNAASGPKEIRIFPGLGHNDLVARAGAAYGHAIALWVKGLAVSAP